MPRLHRWILWVFPFLLLFISTAARAADADFHAESSATVVLYLALILIAAKLGGELTERLGQPAVLGELLAGILLGNLAFTGCTIFEPLKHDPFIDMFAQVGVVVLLFEVGLESTVAQLLKVGLSSFLVATIGVAAPFALGWLAGAWLLPGESTYAHAFLGATLCATSVGITARVFHDLGQSQTRTARIVLGAAVIDDILGLIILAVIGGIIQAAGGTGASFGVSVKLSVAIVIAKAVAFLFGALLFGTLLTPRLFRAASRLQSRGVLLAAGLSFCFVLAWFAGAIGLAPIVGAFAAGLILEDFHFQGFTDRGEHALGELVAPISSFLVPIFFVVMGARTDLGAFAQPGVLGLAALLTAAAILGKQFCGLAVLEKGVDRLTVGIGMIPRGEVGLIFAGTGMTLKIAGEPVISGQIYSALVIMVVMTMITPLLLKWSLARSRRAAG